VKWFYVAAMLVAALGCDCKKLVFQSVGAGSVSRIEADAGLPDPGSDGGPDATVFDASKPDAGSIDSGFTCLGKIVVEQGDGGSRVCVTQIFVVPPADGGIRQGFGTSVTLHGDFTYAAQTLENGDENFIIVGLKRVKMQTFNPPIEERTKFSLESSTLCGAVRINNQNMEAALVYVDGGSSQLQPGVFSECTAFYKGIALVNSQARGFFFWKNGLLSSQLPMFPGSTLVGETNYVGFCGENGEVCGHAGPSPFVPMSYTPFMLVDGGFVPLRHTGPVTYVAATHPNGHLVGTSLIGGLTSAVEWKTDGTERILPSRQFVPNVYARAVALNKHSEIVGEFLNENGNRTAVLWIGEALFLLNDAAPNADTIWIWPLSISDDGFITGAETFVENAEDRSRPFLIHFKKMP
jgi:hypothetical protein